MSATADQQQFSFQTEIRQLLHLLSHSLYQNRDITLRELVSNASDALDKMRFLSLQEEQLRDETPLEISIEPDADAGTLTIRDSGIGMTKQELIENLGTIARSGSLEFVKQLSSSAEQGKEQQQDQALSLIGQFGVGFYSSFMLADRVEVLTRSAREESGWVWESEGTGEFTIQPAEDLPRLDDPPRGAGAHLLEGTAPGPIDAREAKDVQRQAGDRRPLRLGLHPPGSAPRGGGERRRLVHPAAAMIAIDAGGREIPRPGQARRGLGDLGEQRRQHRIARLGRPGRDQQMRRLLERVPRRILVGAGPEQRHRAARADRRRLLGAASGPVDAPTLWQQQPRQRLCRIAVSEGKQGVGHAP